MQIRGFLTAIAAALSVVTSVHAAAAYPEKPIRLVVPWPAGGSSDSVARMIGRYLQDRLKQNVIVDNKPGASGNIGTAEVARATPDGYTLLLSTGPFSINPSLYRKLPFDTTRDFVPIAHIASTSSLLVVNPSVPARTAQEFVALAREPSKPLAVATPGNGTAQHLALELMRKKAGLSIMHVPYKGGALALTDVLGAQVPAMLGGLPELITYVKNGKLRALAVSTEGRSSLLPDVPTLSELGLADSSSGGWTGIHAPARTPADIVNRLHDDVNAVLDMPKVREQFAALGFEVRRSSQQQFATFVSQQMARWKEAVAISGAQID